MSNDEWDDYIEVTYTSLQILKKKGIRIICDGVDITNEIEDLKWVLK